MSTLRVNQPKITAENAFNPDHLWMERKHEAQKKRGFFLDVFADSWVVP